MATAIQRRRGNTAQHASFTGLAGEITIDTQKNTVVVHDGTTAGGYPLARADEVAALGGADITAVVAGDGLTGGATSGNATINIGAGAGITVNTDNVAINAAYFDVTAGGTGWTGNLEPSANNTYSLGSPTRVWKDVYVGPNSLVIDGVELGITGGVLTFGGANVAVAGSSSSNADTRALFSATDAGGDGSFSYSSSTGVFTYTGPSQAEANTRIDARLSGGTGITYTSGVIAVDSTIATKDYANTAATNAVAAVIDSAPAALDTLNELAAALGDDANFSTTITTSISNKLATADFSSTANTWISTQSTTALAEGTNLYFTAARARGNISVTDAGGDGSLSYDSGTGVITYTGPSQSEANARIDARLSGGTGVTYSSGVISIGQAVGTTSSVTFGNVTAPGIFQTGATNVSVELGAASGIIAITSGSNSTQFLPSGQINLGGTSTIAGGTFSGSGFTAGSTQTDLFQNRGGNVTIQVGTGGTISNTWTFAQNGSFTSPGTINGNLTGNVTGTVSTLSNHDTADLAEGTNLYFTAARVRGNISHVDAGGDGSLSYDNSTGVITYTGPSQAEANTRIDARLSGGTGVTYSSGVISIGQSVASNANVSFNRVSNLLAPTSPGDAANKQYVDEIAQGLHTHDPVDAATTTTLATISGGTVTYSNGTDGVGATLTTTGTYTTIDGVTLSNGMRILVKNEANAAHNGIYDRTSTTVLTRSDDFNTPAEIFGGDFTFVTAGTLYDNTGWVMTEKSIAVGTTAVHWSQFSGAGAFTAGNALVLTGTEFNVVTAASGGIEIVADALQLKSSVAGTGLTYSSGVITANATYIKGLFSATDSGGDGSFSYSDGVFTYTGPSATEVRAHFTAGTGVAISSGQISIGQAVATTSNVSFNNVTATGNFFGNVTGNLTGNAGTATTLATARTIGGVSFNGSADINLPGVNTAGTQNTSGNAATATKWATARTITLTGDVTGVSGDFDGTGNLSFATTIAANSVALGTDTTGNYVASVANGAYITGGAAGSEGATLTLAVDATTTATASKVAARDASGDLYAAIFQGTASSARYADLAERYEADAILEPGTVVCFGGEKEITACDHENDHAVAGVVSTDPAYMMNSAAGNNDTHPYIALTGRVPVKVVGPVAKGDLLVASEVKGHAMANNNAKAGTIIGKAISSSDNGESVVEALINLM
jgi:hypothetical protein